jgi:carbon-monoxide dehydrogenase medium subunit
MYPTPFRYHRARSLEEACALLSELGPEARLLAGGQSLIPLMKLRLASPAHLVDLGFIPNINYIRRENGTLRLGALTRHAQIEASAVAAEIPILHDCAAGIADVQVRNAGTLGGSLAEADPSGDWAPVLLTLGATVHVSCPAGPRSIPLSDFIVDAYSTSLRTAEVIREISLEVPPAGSAGCYIAAKRCAPVYATASAAVQLTLDGAECRAARIALGCVGLTPVRPAQAERALEGRVLDDVSMEQAVEAARAACQPQPDMRGSAEYKRHLAGALLRRAIAAAAARCRGAAVEVNHIYG